MNENAEPKKVPLVVYRGGDRLIIGEAEVVVDNEGVHISSEITDPEIKRKLHEPLGAISVGLVPPVAVGNFMLSRDRIADIFGNPPSKFTFEFREPLYLDGREEMKEAYGSLSYPAKLKSKDDSNQD